MQGRKIPGSAFTGEKGHRPPCWWFFRRIRRHRPGRIKERCGNVSPGLVSSA
ncbi:MAG TPA: hypothetical protein VEI51_03845 [Methanomicrobiales archaeon]|nr:hypothetical protein [Methanomicrobiales archaeon]